MPVNETDALETETARADAANAQRGNLGVFAIYAAALLAPIVGLFIV